MQSPPDRSDGRRRQMQQQRHQLPVIHGHGGLPPARRAQRRRALPRAEPVHPAGAAWLTASTAVAGAVPRRLVWPVAPYHFIEISKP